jgi:alpha-mannosidase
LPDTFGYSAQLPQLLKKGGMKYFLTQKLSWSAFNKFPHNSFNWKGIDGTSVLTHFPPADDYSSNGTVKNVLTSENNFKDKGRSNCSLMLFGVGDGGGGPLTSHIESLVRMKDLDV